MKARFYLDVEFKGRNWTEGMASALDNVVRNGMTALGDCWGEYGGKPKIGEVFILDTKQAEEHADTLHQVIAEYTDPDDQLNGVSSELGKSLAPIRDFLRQIAGKQ